MQFAGKNLFHVGDKEIVVDDQIKMLKISHTFSSGREKYLEGIIGIIIIINNNYYIITYNIDNYIIIVITIIILLLVHTYCS